MCLSGAEGEGMDIVNCQLEIVVLSWDLVLSRADCGNRFLEVAMGENNGTYNTTLRHSLARRSWTLFI